MSERGRFDPIDVLVEACRSLVGRILMVALAFSLGCGLGGLLVTGEWIALLAYTLTSIGIAFGSILASYGLMVMPMVFGFAFFYIRFEWSEKSLVVPMALAAFLAYDMIGDAMERERWMREKIEESLGQSIEESLKQEE